jgi:hypothetical protein
MAMAEQRQGSVQAAAGGGRGGRKFPEMKNKELKQRAVEFYAKHKVTDALEKLLNQLFIAAPGDVYGYMVRARVCIVRHGGATQAVHIMT